MFKNCLHSLLTAMSDKSHKSISSTIQMNTHTHSICMTQDRNVWGRTLVFSATEFNQCTMHMQVCVHECASQALAFLLGGSSRGTPPEGVKGIRVVTFFPIVSIYINQKHTIITTKLMNKGVWWESGPIHFGTRKRVNHTQTWKPKFWSWTCRWSRTRRPSKINAGLSILQYIFS